MLYRSLERIAAEADVLAAPDPPAGPGLSRRERLERWAEALERGPAERLPAITGVEHGPRRERQARRADGSPLAVAYADPALRAAGLRGDTIGYATAFFGMSHARLHGVICSCHHGQAVAASEAAAQVRALAPGGSADGPAHPPRPRGGCARSRAPLTDGGRARSPGAGRGPSGGGRGGRGAPAAAAGASTGRIAG